jgi:hypothetical protein
MELRWFVDEARLVFKSRRVVDVVVGGPLIVLAKSK